MEMEETRKEIDFHFMATGIGSVPSLDIQQTCSSILTILPGIPFWPQFIRRSHLEDMSIQFSEGWITNDTGLIFVFKTHVKDSSDGEN